MIQQIQTKKISETWNVKKLKDIGKISNGNSINEQIKKKYLNLEEGLPYIATKDISYDNKIDYDNGARIPKSDLDKFKISKKNSTFICAEGGSAGRKIAFNTKDVCFVNKLFSLEPSDFVEPKLVYYFYQTEDFQKKFKSLLTGLIGGVSMNKFKEIEISLPSKAQQKRIVEILDKSFESINKAKENAEKNLKNAKEIFESYLKDVFENKGKDWEETNLEEHIKLIDYRGRTPVKTKNGVRLITAKNVKLGYLQLEPQEFINKDNYNIWMTRGIPNFGDVIFTTEAPLANVAQINIWEKLAFAQRIIVMQPQKNKIDPTFLKYMLLSKPIRNKILEKGTGATVQGIKSKLLKKIRIYFPKTINEQQSIVTKLDTLSAETKKLEAIYQEKLNDLEELKKSILQKAFNGELVK